METSGCVSGAGVTIQPELLDCFKFHANYGNFVRKHYREIMAQLAESVYLEHVAECITGRRIKVTKLSTGMGDLIRESEYAIC